MSKELTSQSATIRLTVLRLIVLVTLALGVNYLAWRWLLSLNLDAWWIAIPLVVAETYSLIDVSLFGLTMWQAKSRPRPPAPSLDATVDVFITTYDEDPELVATTARAARAIHFPHTTWILDDGARPELEAVATELGVGYITRSEGWKDRPRHAKAGNLNNALMETDGEFVLVLDADQVPHPAILDRTLGYFTDPEIALVQTPQKFGNVTARDPLGSEAPLFYGPIQQGKDGWNAAFFCGSNAVLRRDALMQLGLSRYAADVTRAVGEALAGADRVLARAIRSEGRRDPIVRAALVDVAAAIGEARGEIAGGEALGSATYRLQRRVDAIARSIVAIDAHMLADDLKAIRDLESERGDHEAFDIERMVVALGARELSPLGAFESVRALLLALDVDRSDEAQPLMPLATISVTEDMATSMRLHALGWKSAYHHETLAIGLAPEDLGSMLTQRLRWGQGTMQVMLRENPLVVRGLRLSQRLMYFSTMWGYLGGFAAIVYFAAPMIFLFSGVLPVNTTALEFFLRFLPFIAANQLLFAFAGRGISTWRGQQYSLALFPIWIRATTSAAANVFFGRPLGFSVTPKTRQTLRYAWKLVAPQIVVATLLVIAALVGIARLAVGLGDPIGTTVNVLWVIFDLLVLSVIVPALRYKGFPTARAQASVAASRPGRHLNRA
ncbi:MAG: glycosyltransferase [Pseudolysinimonas sp.]